MSTRIIIGKNFGDEGKGLATDYFAYESQRQNKSCIVIRHNGGGQAGHTVDLPDKRFIFHQLSSGSFRDADTYWASTFLPDLYKISEEIKDFSKHHNRIPRIYAHPMCRCVYIDDVLINMALETSRGDNRHGSCGMGINESVERSKHEEFCLFIGQIRNMTLTELYEKLLTIRKKYVPIRLSELGLTLESMGEYGELITDPQVILNAATEILNAAQMVNIIDESIIHNYDDIIFEGAQGLLLDEDNLQYAPHLTTSKTGIKNPCDLISRHLPDERAEIVYITRSYVTRHGAGPLPYENIWDNNTFFTKDETNITNPWQGSLRFAPHGTTDDFFKSVSDDLKTYHNDFTLSFMITHLNETNGKIVTITGNKEPSVIFVDSPYPVYKLYLSSSPYPEDISTKTEE